MFDIVSEYRFVTFNLTSVQNNESPNIILAKIEITIPWQFRDKRFSCNSTVFRFTRIISQKEHYLIVFIET